MKQILAVLFITLSIAACKKTTPTTPITNDFKPLDDRLPKESGEWNITDVSYDGVIVNPNNPNLSLPFNGTGQNISGFFKFQSNPNYGEFSISFLAIANIGTSQPLTVPITESLGGQWKVNENNDIVTVWRNDTVFDWQVLTNLETRQEWKTRFYLDFGSPYDSVAVNVKTTFVRK